jgi:hypothetical protein
VNEQEACRPDAERETNVCEKNQGKLTIRRRPRLTRAGQNTVLTAAVGGLSTALANGLLGFVLEALRAMLGR